MVMASAVDPMPYVVTITTVVALVAAWVLLFRRVMRNPNRENDYTPRDSATL
jgi:hypothetical protein